MADDRKIREGLAALVFDMTLKYGEVFELIVRIPEEIEYLIKLGSPFMDSILTDGKIKYGTETFKRTCGKGTGTGAGIPA